MSKIQDPKLQDVINLVVMKLGKNEAELLVEYEEIKKAANSALTDAEKSIYAREKLKASYKTQIRSPAVMIEGLLLGVGDLIDTITRDKTVALQLFKVNPDKATKEGYTDAQGVPLDRTPAWGDRPNPNYGKPLPAEAYMKRLVVIGSYGGNPPRAASMILNDDQAKQDLVKYHGAKVAFRANIPDKQPSELVLKLNPSTTTKFESSSNQTIPEVEVVLKSAILDPFRCAKLVDLAQYHETHKGDKQSFVIVTARVSEVSDSPNPKTGNYMMVLDSLLDNDLPLDHPGITVWVPGSHGKLINFDSPSVVTIIGTTQQSEWQDQVRMMINAMGIYVDPKWRFAKAEKPSGAVRQVS